MRALFSSSVASLLVAALMALVPDQAWALSAAQAAKLLALARSGDHTALSTLRHAALSGNPNASASLGLFDEGRKDYRRAFAWFKRAARAGLAFAQLKTGLYYGLGRGIAKNPYKAARMFRQAAEQGYAPAQYEMGILYDSGKGVAVNYHKAMAWFKRSAANGYTAAQVQIGSLYYYGHGVQQNYLTAAKWYRKAAAFGNAAAETGLGDLYAAGYGVKRNLRRAVYYWREAARRGNAQAEHNLGVAYLRGKGVSRDDFKAAKWMLIAKADGATGMTRAIAAADSALSAAQIRQAHQVAATWKATHHRRR